MGRLTTVKANVSSLDPDTGEELQHEGLEFVDIWEAAAYVARSRVDLKQTTMDLEFRSTWTGEDCTGLVLRVGRAMRIAAKTA